VPASGIQGKMSSKDLNARLLDSHEEGPENRPDSSKINIGTTRLPQKATTILPSSLGSVSGDISLTFATFDVGKDPHAPAKGVEESKIKACCGSFARPFKKLAGALTRLLAAMSRLCLDCLSRSRNQSMIFRETKSRLFWLFFLATALYGLYNWWAQEFWSTKNMLDDPNPALKFLGVARFAGSSITLCTIMVLVSMNKILSNSVNELPHYRRRWFSWRESHKYFATLLMFFGIIHTVAHHTRQYYAYCFNETDCPVYPNRAVYDNLESYEIWSTVTGYVLWLSLFGLSLHYIMLAVPRWCIKPNGALPLDQQGKVWFRKFHIPFYLMFTLFYTLHCYNVWPLLFYTLYKLSYYMFELPLKEAYYCFNVKGKRSHFTNENEYDLELWFQLGHDVPSTFGLYCQLQIDNVMSSYTVIPDAETNHLIHFKIRKCVLTEKFRKMINNDQKEMNSGYGGSGESKIPGATPISPVLYNMHVYGPFHSSDLELANSKKLCVLTTGIGGTVAYSTIAYAHGRPRHWDNLLIVHYDKNFKSRDEATRMGVSATQAAIKCSSFEDLTTLATKGSQSAATFQCPVTGTSFERNVIAPTFVSLEGRLHASFTRKLIVSLHAQGFDFLICSRIWTDLIEKCNEMEPLQQDIVRALHIEEFD